MSFQKRHWIQSRRVWPMIVVTVTLCLSTAALGQFRAIETIEIGLPQPLDNKKFVALVKGINDSEDWKIAAAKLYTEYLRWEKFPQMVGDRVVVEQRVLQNATGQIGEGANCVGHEISQFRVRFGSYEKGKLLNEPGEFDVLVTEKIVPGLTCPSKP